MHDMRPVQGKPLTRLGGTPSAAWRAAAASKAHAPESLALPGAAYAPSLAAFHLR